MRGRMTFISLPFLIFFAVVISLYFIIPHKWRWLLLLVASCLFYISFIPVYILVLFSLIIIDYLSGILIARSKGFLKKLFLIVSIFSTIAVLFVFKYFNFFSINLEELTTFLEWRHFDKLLTLVLPIGLSFHTFQSLAYVIEVYRGRQKPEYNLGIYALYVMFFPQLMAGPIERPFNMLHQFHEEHNFDYQQVVSGLRLMLWGAFQKVVIADRVAAVVNLVYKDPTLYTGLPLIVATVMFAFQIFCDFAGYSNIAIGAARIMGFDLMKNFDGPYLARSIREFWQRWHISLSTWFRDYFYIPLGGNRVGRLRWVFNIMATFLVSGLWHGANWTFVVWGGLHGFFLLVFAWSKKIIKKLSKPEKRLNEEKQGFLDILIQTGITFVLASFAWIFFRAKDLTDAFYVLSHLFINLGQDLSTLLQTDLATIATLMAKKQEVLGMTIPNWLVVVISIFVMSRVNILQHKRNISKFLLEKPLVMRWAIYYALILIVLFYAAKGREQFIYFQF